MRFPIKSLAVISVIIIFLLSGCKTVSVKNEQQEKAVPVRTIKVSVSEIDLSQNISGTAFPFSELDVKSELMTAKVEKVNFREGDSVKKDDVVIEFDNTEPLLKIKQEKLRLEDALSEKRKNEVEKQEQIFSIEKELTESEADYLRKKIYFSNAKDDVETKKKLFRINAATLEELKSAERELQKTEIDLKASENTYNTLLKMFSKEKNLRLEKYDIIIRQSQNNIDKSELEIKRLELELDKYVVRSPITGIISDLDISEDMHVDAKDDFIFRIIDTKDILVSVNVSESDIFRVRKDEEAVIIFDAMKNTPFAGIVYSVKPVIDVSSRSFPVKIKVSNDQGLIRPGMFCRVDFSNKEKKKGIFIPQDIIRKTGNSSYVFKVRNNVAVRTLVRTGVESEGKVEILSGISEGDLIISEGIDRVRDLSGIEVVR